jgi:hypothetical protein
MVAVWLNNKRYEASSPRKHTGLYPYTCDAFIQTARGLFPVRTQIKLYEIAQILRGEKAK